MHETLKILALVGGISRESVNRSLFGFLGKEAPPHFRLESFPIENLPFFSQDLEEDLPEQVLQLKAAIDRADGILFITPEYNRSYPGALKNAIDWGSRPWLQNSWENKPAALMGASIGAIGTFGAQAHLRAVLSYLDMPVMNQPEFYFNITSGLDENGGLTSTARELVRDFLTTFDTFVRGHK